MSQRDTGAHYELQARRHLERAGLIFQAANVTYQSGEIDLIMRDGPTWVFVEVRFRRNALFGGAAASVTYRKQQRLLRAAAIWLTQRGGCFATTPCRFDVFAITGSQLEWLPNAFNAD
ncbi:YraN family protein [Yersinia aleksiciae]|uniref:YraN family protein n=1 Tax=Yersinia aleksiciae TaxID=263819 RepID=UPI0011AA9E2A|nr:YraN family protein [Yersinia aleksiciae]MDN0124908.1 YraN family protein [Yersinia aleksiciae]